MTHQEALQILVEEAEHRIGRPSQFSKAMYEALKTLLAPPVWYTVKEKMPPLNQPFLVYGDNKKKVDLYLGIRTEENYWNTIPTISFSLNVDRIIEWQELPNSILAKIKLI